MIDSIAAVTFYGYISAIGGLHIEREVRTIPKTLRFGDLTKVGIYCRVSSATSAQLHSLATQASVLTQLVARQKDKLILSDIYLDVISGTSTEKRTEFNRMIDDIKSGRIEYIITKSISRFGRNAEDILVNTQLIRDLGAVVYFQEQDISSNAPGNDMYVSIYAAVAASESEAISSNIKWGIKKRIEDGSSTIFDRPCYGYRLNDEREFEIIESEASTVRKIFAMYLDGLSVVKIKAELESAQIPSPSGKNVWSKHTIESILTNKKYCGYSFVYHSYSTDYPKPTRKINKGEHAKYEIADHHQPIITQEFFDKAQELRVTRSNIELDESGTPKRKATRYSCKLK